MILAISLFACIHLARDPTATRKARSVRRNQDKTVGMDGKSTTTLIETFSAHQKARTNESLGANLSDGNHSANATEMETGFSMCNGFIRNMVAKNVVKRAEKNIEDIETCAALDVLRDCDACNDVGCLTEACLNPLTNAQKELTAGFGEFSEEAEKKKSWKGGECRGSSFRGVLCLLGALRFI